MISPLILLRDRCNGTRDALSLVVAGLQTGVFSFVVPGFSPALFVAQASAGPLSRFLFIFA